MHFHFDNVITFPDLSEKNPIEILPHNATLLSLLAIFSRGTHRSLYIQLNSFLAHSITTSSVNQVCRQPRRVYRNNFRPQSVILV